MDYFTLRDLKAQSFGLLRSFPSRVDAQRALQAELANPDSAKSVLFLHHTDFELWQAGVFDQSTGAFVSKLDFVCPVTTLMPPSISSLNDTLKAFADSADLQQKHEKSMGVRGEQVPMKFGRKARAKKGGK